MTKHRYAKTQKWKQAGFTLIELLFALLIFGILLAIAAPSFIGQRPRQELKGLTRGIVSDMQFAKVSALKNSATWAIQFDTANSQYKILKDDGAVFKTVSLSNFPGVVFAIPSGYGTVGGEADPGDGISFTDNQVRFNSNGTADEGTVYVSNSNNDAFAVGSTSAAGRVKTWRNYGSGWES